jgi:hypothetical protein
MKRVAEALGVSRSNLAERAKGMTPPRGPYRKAEDAMLLPIIRSFVDERPTYGYRRITALVNRELAIRGLPGVPCCSSATRAGVRGASTMARSW